MGVSRVVLNENGEKRTVIDLEGDTVTAETLGEGETAHDANGDPIVGVAPKTAVLYTSQSLSDAQKAQARKNIGAISEVDVPKKGIDYWTEADQEAIVQQVITALGTPVFGTVDADNKITLSVEHLADGTYYLGYEDKDGNWVEIGTLNHAVVPEPTYTNQIPISTDTDGSVFNGTGYKLDSRINSSGNLANNNTLGTPKAAFATGFIPVAEGDVIRFKNCYIDTKASTTNADVYGTNANGLSAFLYQANKAAWMAVPWAVITSNNKITNLITDANGYVTEFTFTNCQSLRFVRFALAGDAPNAIVTVNEQID